MPCALLCTVANTCVEPLREIIILVASGRSGAGRVGRVALHGARGARHHHSLDARVVGQYSAASAARWWRGGGRWTNKLAVGAGAPDIGAVGALHGVGGARHPIYSGAGRLRRSNRKKKDSRAGKSDCYHRNKSRRL